MLTHSELAAREQLKMARLRDKSAEIQAELDELLAVVNPDEGHLERVRRMEIAAERHRELYQTARDEWERHFTAGLADGELVAVNGDGARGGGQPWTGSLDADPARGEIRTPRHSMNPWRSLPSPAPFTMGGLSPTDVRSRAVDAAAVVSGANDNTRAKLVDLVERHDDAQGNLGRQVLYTTAPAYQRAFWQLLKGETILSAEEVEAVRAVREVQRAMGLTGGSGGYLIPAQLDPNVIITGAGIQSDVAKIAREEWLTQGDAWNGVAAGQISASWDGEAGEVSDDSPTLTAPTVNLHKSQLFAPYSIELGLSALNLTEQIVRLFVDAQLILEGTAFVTGVGDGSVQPTGIVTAIAATAGSRVAATTNNSFALADVYKLRNDLPPRHKPGAAWLAEEAIYGLIRQFDTYGGAGMWTQLPAGTPGQMLGAPAYAASVMDAAIGTGDDDILLIGDFRNYLIARRLGLVIEPIQHLFATGNNRPSGQRGFYGFAFLGAGCLDTDAFRILRV